MGRYRRGRGGPRRCGRALAERRRSCDECRAGLPAGGEARGRPRRRWTVVTRADWLVPLAAACASLSSCGLPPVPTLITDASMETADASADVSRSEPDTS